MDKKTAACALFFLWSIVAVYYRQTQILGVSLGHYLLYLLAAAGLLCGALRGELLSPVVRVTAALILALWFALACAVFTDIFAIDDILLSGNAVEHIVLLGSELLVGFFAFFVLCPFLVSIFGQRFLSMAVVVVMPALLFTAYVNAEHPAGVFIMALAFVAKGTGVALAAGLAILCGRVFRQVGRGDRG